MNRDPTNRINAAIELFQSGIIAITTTNYQLPTTDSLPPPTTSYQLPTNPPGFIGVDQDADWAAAAFPNDFAAITNKGYETWLMEDCVGINEPNGRYKVSVTIAALPEHGPCYLVVGPHRMVVTQPGTYSFPLEVFTDYTARTYPTAVPLSVSYDEGYREDSSSTSAPAPLMAPPLPQMTSAANGGSNEVSIRMDPEPHVSPSWMYCDEIGSTMVRLYWNVPNYPTPSCTTDTDLIGVSFVNQFTAWIIRANTAGYVYFSFRHAGYERLASLRLAWRTLINPADPSRCAYCQSDDCPCHGNCGETCNCHVETNGVHCTIELVR